MLAYLFRNVLSVSLSTSVVIGLFYLAGPVLRKRYSPKLSHFIWGLICLKLLIPFSVNTGLHFTIPATMVVSVYEGSGRNAGFDAADQQAEDKQNGEDPAADQIAPDSRINGIDMLAGLWISGVAFFTAVNLCLYICSKCKLLRWSCKVRDRSILAVVDHLKRELGITQTIEIYICPILATPMLIGLMKPRILLPSCKVANEYLEQVLRHELTHYTRHDLWYKLGVLAAGIIHWFNPLVWMMARRAEIDMELSCDSDVLIHSDRCDRQMYGLSILEYATSANAIHIPLSTQLYGGKKQMKQRIQLIADGQKKRSSKMLGGIAIAAVLICSVTVGTGMGVSAATSNTEGAVAQTQISSVKLSEPRSSRHDKFPLYYANDDHVEPIPEPGGWTWPVPGHTAIIRDFVQSSDDMQAHSRISISGEEGAPVVAALSGVVRQTNETDDPDEAERFASLTEGYYVALDHGNGVFTTYYNLGEYSVKPGDIVKAGQEIGKVGTTGWPSYIAGVPQTGFELIIDPTGEGTKSEIFFDPMKYYPDVK